MRLTQCRSRQGKRMICFWRLLWGSDRRKLVIGWPSDFFCVYTRIFSCVPKSGSLVTRMSRGIYLKNIQASCFRPAPNDGGRMPAATRIALDWQQQQSARPERSAPLTWILLFRRQWRRPVIDVAVEASGNWSTSLQIKEKTTKDGKIKSHNKRQLPQETNGKRKGKERKKLKIWEKTRTELIEGRPMK